MTTGPGIFYDGLTSARHAVTVEIGGDAVNVRAANGGLMATWRFADVAPLASPAGVLRLGPTGRGAAARLEIRDPALMAALLEQTGTGDRTGLTDRRTRNKVVVFSVAAIVSVVAGGIWGVPLLAGRIAPNLPVGVEMRLGSAVEPQIRQMLDTKAAGKSFECGATDAAARAALAKLVGTLETAAALPLPLRTVVVRRPEANAIALPGGRIYMFEGLLTKAKSVDEVAGVLAHEIGHVAHRDNTKSILQAAGLSFLFGMVLGDFAGGGAVVMAARTGLQSAYSRDTEAAADDYGATLVSRVGGDPHALGAILLRISGVEGQFPHYLLDHPQAQQRADAIDRIPQPVPMTALLTPAEWAALKKICAGR